ncbi:hypothetical protein [Fusobacterium varium]|uniref:hypothetical protein n=1 Tax=Fusobacterium varium TaxID=856 RepID=UPI00266B44DA|nr:hypothetical protein [Fusobacterium varium]
MKKQIYGLIKYNYEVNKKRNIFFKYYDFYPNKLNQKEEQFNILLKLKEWGLKWKELII